MPVSWTVITSRCEPEELPYIGGSCYICHPLPSRPCCSSVALCTFLVEGPSFSILPFSFILPVALHLIYNYLFFPHLLTVGPVHNIENTRPLGSVPAVCGTQAPFPPRLSISQVEICLRKRQMTGNIPTSPWEAAVGHF